MSDMESNLNFVLRKNEHAPQGVNQLTQQLRDPDTRQAFVERNGTMALCVYLQDQSDNNVQIIYETGFCLWLLTYNHGAVLEMLDANIIPLLHHVLRVHKKEKCARVALMILHRLVDLSERKQLTDVRNNRTINIWSQMISVGLPRTVTVLAKRQFADTDINEHLEALSELLEKNIEESSSFAEYKQEVLSGRLAWTPVHTSEKFWKENMKEFEADNFKVLRDLANILNTSGDAEVLAVACHDFGEFVRLHPQGRKVMSSLDVKGKILELMQHKNPEVAKRALLCTQKIMVQKWEFLGQ